MVRGPGATSLLVIVALALIANVSMTTARDAGNKLLIAHRGASAYAPEHTLAAYQLALDQGADFVEQDLALTKDGALVCLHDITLERTTNVEDVFPDRFIEDRSGPSPVRRWPVYDFTLAEIKKLDAGSWFDHKFAGARIVTFQEAIDLVKGKAGLFPELKDPAVYRAHGLTMEPLVANALRKNGLDHPASGSGAIILQSFDEASLREMAKRIPDVPRIGYGRPLADVRVGVARSGDLRDRHRSGQSAGGPAARGRALGTRRPAERDSLHLPGAQHRPVFHGPRGDGAFPVLARCRWPVHGQPGPVSASVGQTVSTRPGSRRAIQSCPSAEDSVVCRIAPRPSLTWRRGR
jgi:glycerophosphoryl diester phosphodiesterase